MRGAIISIPPPPTCFHGAFRNNFAYPAMLMIWFSARWRRLLTGNVHRTFRYSLLATSNYTRKFFRQPWRWMQHAPPKRQQKVLISTSTADSTVTAHLEVRGKILWPPGVRTKVQWCPVREDVTSTAVSSASHKQTRRQNPAASVSVHTGYNANCRSGKPHRPDVRNTREVAISSTGQELLITTNQPTYSTEQSQSWEANSSPADQEISHHFMEHDYSLPRSQQPLTCAYPEPN